MKNIEIKAEGKTFLKEKISEKRLKEISVALKEISSILDSYNFSLAEAILIFDVCKKHYSLAAKQGFTSVNDLKKHFERDGVQ